MGLQRWGNEPWQHTSFGGQGERAFTAYILWSSGFVRMELLRLTDVQSGPGQTRMSHWRCDILRQVALKSPSVWDGLFTRSSLSVSPSNSKCSQIFTPPGYMLFMLWLPFPPANEKNTHSAGCMPLRLWFPLTLQRERITGCGKIFRSRDQQINCWSIIRNES